jgi:hypothetical protein
MERTWLEGMNVVDNGALCAGDRKPVCLRGEGLGDQW